MRPSSHGKCLVPPFHVAGICVAASLSGFGCARLIAGDKTPELGVGQTASVPWRTHKNCGANSVYILSRIQGHDVSYDMVIAGLPPSNRGLSLGQLRNYCEGAGIAAKVVQLAKLPGSRGEVPFIALVDMVDDQEEEEAGHFVVIIRANDKEVSYVDGTTAMIHSIAPSVFNRRWTGYAMTIENKSSDMVRYAMVGAAAVVAALLAAYLLFGPQQKSEQ